MLHGYTPLNEHRRLSGVGPSGIGCSCCRDGTKQEQKRLDNKRVRQAAKASLRLVEVEDAKEWEWFEREYGGLPMKLWLLRPIEGDTLFSGWDTAQGFVIRAETEGEARSLAHACGGAEGRYYGSWESTEAVDTRAWTSAEHSTCVELTADGPTEIVMRDFLHG